MGASDTPDGPANTGPRFQQQRKEWATAADRLAHRCYRDHYGIAETDIYDVESLVEEVHDREGGYRTHQILDYGGVDKILDCGDRHVYVAQRWRPVDGGDDLPLRVETGVEGRTAELGKWRRAYRTHGFYPSAIAFGKYEAVLQAFQTFHLFETEVVLAALEAGYIDPPVHGCGDGTAAAFIPIADLRAAGAELAAYERVIAGAEAPGGEAGA
jgi:hypothetical protein